LFPTRLELPVPREVERGDQPEVEAEVVVVEELAGPNRGYEIRWFQSGMLGYRNAGTRKLNLRLQLGLLADGNGFIRRVFLVR
jgi:hypothetical protein